MTAREQSTPLTATVTAMSAELPKMRRAFSDWWRSLPQDQRYDFDSEGRGYKKPPEVLMWAAWQEATRQAMERLEPLRHAGAMLSNCAFNLAQRNPGQFTARDIEALDSSRKAWDEVIRAITNESEKRHG